jgi:ribonuclease Z
MSSPTSINNYYRPPLPSPETVICYVCQTPQIRGKFDNEKATELGIKGRDRGKLVRGDGPITLTDGRVVKRSDVISENSPGSVFAIIRCPSMEVGNMLSSQINRLLSYNSVSTTLVYHITPSNVLTSEMYKQGIISKFAPETLHIIVNNDACPSIDAMLCGRSNVILLNQIHSGIFQFQETKPVTTDSNDIKNESTDGDEVKYNENRDSWSKRVGVNEGRCIGAQTKSVVRLVPIVPTPLIQETKEIPPLQVPEDVIQEAKQLGLLPDSPFQLASSSDSNTSSTTTTSSVTDLIPSSEITNDDPEITFLGTGSAIPAKLRNVTSILIQMKSCSMLLDAGEGTYYQLLRHFNNNTQKLNQLLSNIRLIWISHKHADHHLGLSLLLSKRGSLKTHLKNTERESSLLPIVIVCPSPVIGWLTEISKIDPQLQGTYLCIPCVKTASVHPPMQFVNRRARATTAPTYTNVDTSAGSTQRRNNGATILLTSVNDPLQNALNDLGLESLESIAVNHCHLSYGVVLISKTGWKMVFSGDTTPDRRLWERGNNATLLIHEATFDSEMLEDASRKKHSTVAGAIDVGRRMNAKHVILTHFSQRYPRLPVLKGEAAANTPMNNVSVSFDFMTVRMSQLEWLPQMLPALQQLFPEAVDSKL